MHVSSPAARAPDPPNLCIAADISGSAREIAGWCYAIIVVGGLVLAGVGLERLGAGDFAAGCPGSAAQAKTAPGGFTGTRPGG
jgi:hypothetical protein